MRGLLRRLLPRAQRRRIAATMHRLRRRRVRFGSLRRTAPFSREFGFDRGQPIDRHYIEAFLEAHADAIRGRVLEVGTGMYTRRFGGDRVTSAEVLHVAEWKPDVTLVGDLTDAALPLAPASFDCIILTQVLQFVFDAPAVLATVERLLKPGGVLLLTVPGVSPVSRCDMERWGEYWRFTSRAVEAMLRRALPGAELHVEARGNVLAASAFLYGLAADELTPGELAVDDPDFEVVVLARARKAG